MSRLPWSVPKLCGLDPPVDMSGVPRAVRRCWPCAAIPIRNNSYRAMTTPGPVNGCGPTDLGVVVTIEQKSN